MTTCLSLKLKKPCFRAGSLSGMKTQAGEKVAWLQDSPHKENHYILCAAKLTIALP